MWRRRRETQQNRAKQAGWIGTFWNDGQNDAPGPEPPSYSIALATVKHAASSSTSTAKRNLAQEHFAKARDFSLRSKYPERRASRMGRYAHPVRLAREDRSHAPAWECSLGRSCVLFCPAAWVERLGCFCWSMGTISDRRSTGAKRGWFFFVLTV